MATEQLLSDFPPVSTEAWDAVITADLKGASYADKLIWHAPEGVAARPYYRAEDLAGMDWIDALPGAFPFARGARAEAGWHICEEIAAADPAEANRRARAAVAAGAEEIAFRGIAITNVSDLALALADLTDVPVRFAAGDSQRLAPLVEYLNKNPRTAILAAGIDPLAAPDLGAGVMRSAPAALLPFAIEIARTAPAAANATEQLGWALAACIDWIAALEEKGIRADSVARSVEFLVDIGSNYFYEISRLRAFRMLWARVVESFGGLRENAVARIVARTLNQPAAADARHWNMLRATTGAMAAVLGGADSVCVTPYDDSEAARRLARNTQLVLKHEAFFARVADPGGGSYYLEHLTGDVADRAWETMQAIEARGGWRKARA